MKVHHGYALSGKKGSTVKELNAFDDWNLDLSVLTVGGRYYILSHYSDQLGKLRRFDNDGELITMCEYKTRIEPEVELFKGMENTVCTAVLLGRVRYVDYSMMHALGPLPDDSPFSIMELGDKLA